MRRHEDEFRITSLCRVLSLTRAGYYAWRGRLRPSARSVMDAALLDCISGLQEGERL